MIDISGAINEVWQLHEPKMEARFNDGSVPTSQRNEVKVVMKELVESLVTGVLQHILDNAEVELKDWADAVDTATSAATVTPNDGGATLKAGIVSGTSTTKSNKIL